MEPGDIYRSEPRQPDPRRRRAFVVVSRAEMVASRYSTVVCVPLYSSYTGVPTEVLIGESFGMKQRSYARCDEVTSMPRSRLTEFVGRVPRTVQADLRRALAVALDITSADL